MDVIVGVCKETETNPLDGRERRETRETKNKERVKTRKNSVEMGGPKGVTVSSRRLGLLWFTTEVDYHY